MKDAVLSPEREPILELSAFLAALFSAFANVGLRFCILRNYDGFPDQNIGNDLDILILPSDLPLAVRALASVRGIRFAGYGEREFVANLFVEGTSSSAEFRAMQVDFFWNLSFKGLSYLEPAEVLRAAIPRRAGNLDFFVPSPVHEAIVSLFATLLHAGSVKEKYFPGVQRTFASSRSEVIAALQPQFALKAATRLVDSVIEGDRKRVLDCKLPMRASLALRSLLRNPFRAICAVGKFYACEVDARFSPRNLRTVCIIGADSCGNAEVVESLLPMLHSVAQTIQLRSPWQRVQSVHEAHGVDARGDSELKPPGGSTVSTVSLLLLLLDEWTKQLTGRKNLALRICDGCFQDLLIDPQRFGYHGPMWLARLVGRLIPEPELWILLEPAAEALQAGNPGGSSALALRRQNEYRTFVETRENHAVVAAGEPVVQIADVAYIAIIEVLARQAGRRLKQRFHSLGSYLANMD